MYAKLNLTAAPFDSYYESNELEAPARTPTSSTYARAGGVEPLCPEYRRWVQQSLNSLIGSNLSVDGQLGSNSRNAIKLFQRQNGMPAHGIVNEPTEEALRRAGAPPPPLSFPPPAPGAVGSVGWVKGLIPLLEKYRREIPLDFLLGWIAVESAGCVGEITEPALDERGYFQIHKDERANPTLRLDGKAIDPGLLSTDPEYSVRAGLELVRLYMRGAAQTLAQIKRSFGVDHNINSDFFWRMVKFHHAGSGYLQRLLNDMRANGASPTSWPVLREYVTTNNNRLSAVMGINDPSRLTGNVDALFDNGRQLTPRQNTGLQKEFESVFQNSPNMEFELTLESEPFQGYTEFDEAESADPGNEFESMNEFERDWRGRQSRGRVQRRRHKPMSSRRAQRPRRRDNNFPFPTGRDRHPYYRPQIVGFPYQYPYQSPAEPMNNDDDDSAADVPVVYAPLPPPVSIVEPAIRVASREDAPDANEWELIPGF